MLGIALKVVSVMFFVVMSALLKAAPDVPVGQMIFFRSFFAVFPILLFLAWRGELVEGFRTSRPLAHVGRGLIGMAGMSLIFFALTRLPLPEATTINYATPLLIVIFGAVFLKETVRFYRWSAVIVGLGGVLIVMWPRLTVLTGGGAGLNETLGALAALGGCVTAALASLTIRNLLQTERSATIVVYFSLSCSVFALLTLPFGWVVPDRVTLVLLIGSGLLGGLGQICLTEAYRHADISVVAPFEYSSMLVAIVLGYVVFGDVPTIQMLVGGSIVVASGIFIILRERRLGLERAKAGQVVTPQG